MFNQQSMGGFDLSNADTLSCEKCNHSYFESAFVIKKVSASSSPTGQEGVIPIPVFVCKKCGHVNKEFEPTKEKLKNAQIAVPR